MKPFDVDALEVAQKIALREHLLTFVTGNRQELMERALNGRTRYATVALEDIFQPHNASAAIRSCECFGIQDIHIIENRYVYRLNPDVLMGSGKWVRLNRFNKPDADNTAHCLNALKSQGYRLAATVPNRDAIPVSEAPLDEKIALMFGTEEEGLSDAALELADLRLTIPMSGFTQSFNISVSVALCLYEISRRLRTENKDWPLSEPEKLDVSLEWIMSSVKNANAICRRFFQQDNSLNR